MKHIRIYCYTVLCLALLIISAVGKAYAYKETKQSLTMKDGTELNTMIYLPDAAPSGKSLPAVLVRTPYGADLDEDLYKRLMITILTDMNKFAVVGQDLRGTGSSGGSFRMFLDDGWSENRDGYATIEWIASQDWCNGRIGMLGSSAEAIVQYLAAAAGSPHLVCGAPVNGSWNLYDNCVYPGGEYREFDVDNYANMFSSSGMMKSLIREHSNYDFMWEQVAPATRLQNIKVPMLHIGGWFDFFCPGQIEAFRDMQYNSASGARDNQKLVIGPWAHTTVGTKSTGEITFPENAAFNYQQSFFDWFNYWLKDSVNNAVASMPAIKLYLMGPVDTTGYWNNWLDYNEWPFTDTDTLRFFLAGNNQLKEQAGENSSESIKYDPRSPVGTIGGNNLFYDAGPVDISMTWDRADVMTFVTPFYDKPFDLFGNMKLKLSASSDRFDTDFSAWLVDVYPDGRKMLISDGILMARHRNYKDKEELLTPGQVYDFNIDLNYTAYTILPGHRLGLAVSSSNYPKFAVNPNTDSPVHKSNDTLIANNTVYFGGSSPSVLVLPIRKTGFVSVTNDFQTSTFTGNSVTTINNRLELIVENQNEYKAVLYNIKGEIVTERIINADNGTIAMDFDYPPGVYFLMLKNETKQLNYKIMHIKN